VQLISFQKEALARRFAPRHRYRTTTNNLLLVASLLAIPHPNPLGAQSESAVKAIDTFFAQVEASAFEAAESPRDNAFAVSEMQMYKNQILRESKSPEALKHLMEIKDVVLDEGAWLQDKGEIELETGDFEAAESTFMTMFERGMTEVSRSEERSDVVRNAGDD